MANPLVTGSSSARSPAVKTLHSNQLPPVQAVPLDPEQFKNSFANQLSQEETDAQYEKWTMPNPARTLFQLAFSAVESHSPAAFVALGALEHDLFGLDRVEHPAQESCSDLVVPPVWRDIKRVDVAIGLRKIAAPPLRIRLRP
jgi:hypothetical protein